MRNIRAERLCFPARISLRTAKRNKCCQPLVSRRYATGERISAKTSNHSVCRGSTKSRTESLLPQISARSRAANSPGPGQSSPFSANSLRLLPHVSCEIQIAMHVLVLVLCRHGLGRRGSISKELSWSRVTPARSARSFPPA